MNARIQLSRFLAAMRGSGHQIKIAAYKKSSPRGVSIDWTLDCLLNMFDPSKISVDNDNLQIYYQQIQQYAPDLVISDLEYFTSYVANLLDLTVWQCSSSIINYALDRSEKYNAGVFKYFAHALHREKETTQPIINLLDNADRNLVYAHFGDMARQPTLLDKFQWVRPYHQVGKDSVLCRHGIIAALPDGNKQLLGWLKNHTDSVAFVYQPYEKYSGLLVKDIEHQEEYFCNLKNSSLALCRGQVSLLADAFYNGKYVLMHPDYQDPEAILGSQLTQHYGMGSILSLSHDLSKFSDLVVIPNYNNEVKYLHQYIEEL